MQRVGREVRRERVRQAERRRELRAEQARAEDPERHVESRARARPARLARLRRGASSACSSSTSCGNVSAARRGRGAARAVVS